MITDAVCPKQDPIMESVGPGRGEHRWRPSSDTYLHPKAKPPPLRFLKPSSANFTSGRTVLNRQVQRPDRDDRNQAQTSRAILGRQLAKCLIEGCDIIAPRAQGLRLPDQSGDGNRPGRLEAGCQPQQRGTHDIDRFTRGRFLGNGRLGRSAATSAHWSKGTMPFGTQPSMPSMENLAAMLDRAPRFKLCEAFGKSPGVMGLIGVGTSLRLTDQQGRRTASGPMPACYDNAPSTPRVALSISST